MRVNEEFTGLIEVVQRFAVRNIRDKGVHLVRHKEHKSVSQNISNKDRLMDIRNRDIRGR